MREGLPYFQDICKNFESIELHDFFIDVTSLSPHLFFEIQSKKYDQPGGMLCQAINSSLALEKILDYEFIRKQVVQPKKRDCLRIATFLLHSENAAVRIQNIKVTHDIKKGLRDYIAELITNYNNPANVEQLIINFADNFWDVGIDKEAIKKWTIREPDEYFIPECYNYSWCNFTLAIELDKPYFQKLKEKPDTLEPLRTLLEEYL